jgi:cytochrome c-type biogenesis protein CcmH/NrfF
MNRHDLDWFSLLAGLLFGALGVTFLLKSLSTWSANVAWVFPVVLIVLGIAGVVSTVTRHNRTAPQEPSGFVQKPTESGV